MKIEIDDEMMALVAEYDREIGVPTIENAHRIGELQMLITVRVMVGVESEKMYQRVTANVN